MTAASQDREALERLLALPDGVVEVRWAEERLGTAGPLDAIGPVDTQLVAFLRFASHAAAAAALPSAEAPLVHVPSSLAAAVLAPDDLGGVRRVADELLLGGPFYDGVTLVRSVYRVPLVAALGDGLLVYARTW